MLDLAANWHQVRNGVEMAARLAGRDPAEVRLVAVSKFHPAEVVARVAALGQKDFGENYIQEALAKQEALTALGHPDLDWHAIGHIQSKKAKDIVGRFCLIHTLDSLKLATTLNERVRTANGLIQPVLIEVNIGEETQKSGVSANDLTELAEGVANLPFLRLQGLMCLPPNCGEGELARPFFSRLRDLRDALQKSLHLPLPELSMGMSGDYVQAVAEGSTMVRVGTDIFGPRPQSV